MKQQMPSSVLKLVSKLDPEERVFKEDVRFGSSVPENSVDLVVTSPPYPNMTDYALSQRLSYYLLGLDPASDLKNEIGARRKRSARSSIEDYLSDMRKANRVMAERLKPKGYACFVLPEFDQDNENNTLRKKAMQEFLGDLERCGFGREHTLSRMLPTRRRHHNQTWTSLEKEAIFIYRKFK